MPRVNRPSTTNTVRPQPATTTAPATVRVQNQPASFMAVSKKAPVALGSAANAQPVAQLPGQARTTQPIYPPRVTAALGQSPSTWLASLSPPPAVRSQGIGAINEWKMRQLSDTLHGKLYNADGTYKRPAPFNDAEAMQAMYSGAAELSRADVASRGLDPAGDGAKQWRDGFIFLAQVGIGNQPFGDYGFNPIYQDGSPTQAHHFQLALRGSYMVASTVGPIGGTFIGQLGNFQHEFQGAGPSKQDAFNSMCAILITRELSAGRMDPYQASAVIGSALQSGEPILSMDFSNPSNYLWAGPALALPDAQVDRSRYP